MPGEEAIKKLLYPKAQESPVTVPVSSLNLAADGMSAWKCPIHPGSYIIAFHYAHCNLIPPTASRLLAHKNATSSRGHSLLWGTLTGVPQYFILQVFWQLVINSGIIREIKYGYSACVNPLKRLFQYATSGRRVQMHVLHLFPFPWAKQGSCESGFAQWT